MTQEEADNLHVGDSYWAVNRGDLEASHYEASGWMIRALRCTEADRISRFVTKEEALEYIKIEELKRALQQ